MSLITALRANGFATAIHDDGVNPCINLTDEWDSFYGRRSRRLKKGNNLVRNRLNRKYTNIEIRKFPEQINCDAENDQLLNQLIDISSRSWKQETGLTLEQPGPNSFIKTLSAYAIKEGWLSAWLLYLDGEAVAMEYQLNYHGNIYALRADFDTAYNELSPGTFMNMEILKALFSSNAVRYLMGPGENPYKLRWAEEFEQLSSVTAYSTSLRGRLVGFLQFRLVPPIKRLREHARKLFTRKGDLGGK